MNKRTQGKKNRAAGVRFELRVRKDLEEKGWIVSKWMNNVGLQKENSIDVCGIPVEGGGFIYGKLISAKHRFRGPGIPMSIGTGFPDFIAYSFFVEKIDENLNKNLSGITSTMHPDIIGIEVKSNSYLDKEEREKCNWLIQNKIFSKILIASKGEKRGEIKYKEVKHGNQRKS